VVLGFRVQGTRGLGFIGLGFRVRSPGYGVPIVLDSGVMKSGVPGSGVPGSGVEFQGPSNWGLSAWGPGVLGPGLWHKRVLGARL
jgi:hypothetical protein